MNDNRGPHALPASLRRLLPLIADGRFHSGEEIGRALGITRGAVWKAIRSLEELGLQVAAVRGKGYRLSRPMELLAADEIIAGLSEHGAHLLSQLHLFDRVDSTNRYLMRRAAEGGPSGSVCIAEWQTAGRGRRGREWISPFGANIYLSLLWRFPQGPAGLGALSLAIGVAVGRALAHLGLADVGIKWPNDIVHEGRKLAGILVEVGGEANGPSFAVIGVGLNVQMSTRASSEIGQPWVDLVTLGVEPGRNQVCSTLVGSLLTATAEYSRAGLRVFRDEWLQRDAFAGREVRILFPNETVKGIARGIDGEGCLLVETGGKLRRISSGEVSLRPGDT